MDFKSGKVLQQWHQICSRIWCETLRWNKWVHVPGLHFLKIYKDMGLGFLLDTSILIRTERLLLSSLHTVWSTDSDSLSLLYVVNLYCVKKWGQFNGSFYRVINVLNAFYVFERVTFIEMISSTFSTTIMIVQVVLF